MFYGWWIVVTVFVAQLFMIGFFTYGYPFVIVPVKEEFGASTTEISLAMTFATALGMIVPPVAGPLADRWTARGLMVIGGVSLASALALLSVTTDVFQFVLVFGLFISVANTLLGPLTGSAIISRWFTRSRGRALGLAAAGTSVGGFAVPALVTSGIEAVGWRTTLQALAAIVAGVVLPLLVGVLRDHPAERGLGPEGAPPEETPGTPTGAGSGAAGAERPWSSGEILRSRSFWVIGLCLGFLFMGYTAVLSILGLYVENAGLPLSAGRNLVWGIALFGLIGKIALGAATDRIGLRLGLWIALGLAGFGIGLLSLEPGYAWMMLAAASMGLAAGGMLPVWGGMIAAAFGTASIGRAMGLVMPLISVLVMQGFPIAGWSDDRTGSFALAMRVFVGLIGVAIVLLFALELPKDPARTGIDAEEGTVDSGSSGAGPSVGGRPGASPV